VVSGKICGKDFKLSTGHLAKQANGSVMIQLEKTQVLSTVVLGEKKEGQDFFPLSVHYNEKYYAAGKIPGGFFRRETRAGDAEVLVSRLIDRPIRPLFQEGFLNEVQIIPTALSMDGIHPADIAGINGASACILISDIPWNGPVGAARVGRIDGNIIINPTYEEINNSDINLVVAGTVKAITMIEGEAHELSEEIVLNGIKEAHEAIKEIITLQLELKEKAGKPNKEVPLFPPDEKMSEEIASAFKTTLEEKLMLKEKLERQEAVDLIYKAAQEKFNLENEVEPKLMIDNIVHDLEKSIVRSFILKDEIRPDGRGLKEIRPIECRVDVLENVHGSALFTRGQTQALSVTTLGSSKDELRKDEVIKDSNKRFFLHYNFPPYSVGEAGRVGGVGRREVGHGMLAERSLANLLPTKEDFEYTLRVVSEILESNGSSSMATICASSMSLFAAGVPLKKHVAGVAMGLVMDGDHHKILTDIQGMEDYLGDMDFKVAGTRDGITGFQLDIKIEGITPEIMKESLAQAKEARMVILDKMEECIPRVREKVSTTAPQIFTIKVPIDKIRNVIGPSGKHIKAIVEETGSQIDVNDNGEVKIFTRDKNSLENTLRLVEVYTGVPKIGKLYDGKVKKITTFGAFIEIMPGTDGLCHISELSNQRINRVEDFTKEGDSLKVKVIKIDDQGRIGLSHKQAT